jgi:hypothetical protein
MKTIKALAFILLIAFLFACCSKDPNHSVRIKNDYFASFYDVKIGSVGYGTVANGATTDYQGVEEGSHNISGTSSLGQSLTGTISISGKGKHKWTMTITSSGQAQISED